MSANHMPPLIEARDLTKKYGSHTALDRVNFSVDSGKIVGLIGPNGAGKTSALRAVLGLTDYEGYLSVLGKEPLRDRTKLMQEACFIADVAVLPGWLRVDQAIDFVAGVHPRFRRERARALLEKTSIKPKSRMRQLSKGMKTQVHLALTMAIDAKLFVLDEPTLGLDLLARRSFYDALVNDYMDETRTILITTHQVEEVENLLTDVLFIDRGRIVLDSSLERIAERYAAVAVGAAEIDAARALGPFHERRMLGKTILYFEQPDFARLAAFGEVLTPSVSDLFVAKLSGGGGPPGAAAAARPTHRGAA
jgi:ABC-2 type transport system ATP-binding protein